MATCPCLSDDVPICPQPPQFQHRLYQTCLLPERNKCPTAAACPCQSHHHTSRSPGCAGVLGSCPESRCLTLAFASLKLCDPRRGDSPLTYLSGPWLLQGWGWDDHTSCLVPHLPSGHHTTSHLSQSACLRALLLSLLKDVGAGLALRFLHSHGVSSLAPSLGVRVPRLRPFSPLSGLTRC